MVRHPERLEPGRNELKKSHTTLSVLFETTDDMIWTVDPKHFGLMMFNAGLRRYFAGKGILLRAGMTPDDLLPTPETSELWKNFYRRALREGPYKIEYEVVTRTHILDLGFYVLAQDAQVFGIAVFGRDITERKIAERALGDLSGRLINAQEEERARIARELHDGIGQTLSLSMIQLNQALHMQTSSDGRKNIEAIYEKLRCLSSDMSSLAHRLHPSVLKYVGLIGAIEALCRDVNANHSLEIQFTHDISSKLSSETQLCLYRVAQEGLHNVVKHSHASHVSVHLTEEGHRVCLSIRDDGIGFDVESNSSGLGLISIRERVRTEGGGMTIASTPDGGTHLGVDVPVFGKDAPPAHVTGMKDGCEE